MPQTSPPPDHRLRRAGTDLYRAERANPTYDTGIDQIAVENRDEVIS